MGTFIRVMFVVTFVCIVAYYCVLAVTAYKAIEQFDKECKGSVAYCLGKAKKSFDEGAEGK